MCIRYVFEPYIIREEQCCNRINEPDITLTDCSGGEYDEIFMLSFVLGL